MPLQDNNPPVDKINYPFKTNVPNSFTNPPPTEEQVKEAMGKLDNIINRMQNEFLKNRTLIDIKPTTTSIVQVTADQDKILDVINTMPPRLKNKALGILSETEKEHAIFMSLIDEDDERNYAILFNQLGEDDVEPGLVLMTSTDQDAVCAMLAEVSNVTYEKAKEGFSGPGEVD